MVAEFLLELNLLWLSEYEIGKDIKVDFIDTILVGDDKRTSKYLKNVKNELPVICN